MMEATVLPLNRQNDILGPRANGEVMAVTSIIVHPVAKNFVDDLGNEVWTVTVLYNENHRNEATITLDKWRKIEGHRFSQRDAFRLAHMFRGVIATGVPSERVIIRPKPFHMEDYQKELVREIMTGKPAHKPKTKHLTSPVTHGIVQGTAQVEGKDRKRKSGKVYYDHPCNVPDCDNPIERTNFGRGRPPVKCSIHRGK